MGGGVKWTLGILLRGKNGRVSKFGIIQFISTPGQRNAQDIVNAAVNEVKRVANARLAGRANGGGYQQKSGGAGSNAVVELTDANFEVRIENAIAK